MIKNSSALDIYSIPLFKEALQIYRKNELLVILISLIGPLAALLTLSLSTFNFIAIVTYALCKIIGVLGVFLFIVAVYEGYEISSTNFLKIFKAKVASKAKSLAVLFLIAIAVCIFFIIAVSSILGRNYLIVVPIYVIASLIYSLLVFLSLCFLLINDVGAFKSLKLSALFIVHEFKFVVKSTIILIIIPCLIKLAIVFMMVVYGIYNKGQATEFMLFMKHAYGELTMATFVITTFQIIENFLAFYLLTVWVVALKEK